MVTLAFAVVDQALEGSLRPSRAAVTDLWTALAMAVIWFLAARSTKESTSQALLASALLVLLANTVAFGRAFATAGQSTPISAFATTILLIGVAFGLNARWSLVVGAVAVVAIGADPSFEATPKGVLGIVALTAGGIIVFTIRRQLDASLERALGAARTAHADAVAAHVAATKARAREERLEALRTLAAGAAHEYNNPLTYAMGAADEARMEIANARVAPQLPADAAAALRRAEDDLAIAQRGLQRMARITTGLHHATRTIDEPVVEVDPNALVRDVVATAALPAGIVVRETLVSNARIHARRREVEAILAALLTNAGDALTEAGGKGTIEVATRDEGTTVVIEVNDDGPGVDEAAGGRLFTPFFTTKESPERPGLSLSIALRAARDLGGDITYARRPGGGASFRLRLPV